ncbi:hypothetical protein HAX54_008702 [Datura stramonium]|uniref:Uncharacterized protein n=1 Tax=Datura stramonium TaxID=4076 RepID=A0ABS8RVQ1_DATST|nr:hypothetical protein [Datura stramonium]
MITKRLTIILEGYTDTQNLLFELTSTTQNLHFELYTRLGCSSSARPSAMDKANVTMFQPHTARPATSLKIRWPVQATALPKVRAPALTGSSAASVGCFRMPAPRKPARMPALSARMSALLAGPQDARLPRESSPVPCISHKLALPSPGRVIPQLALPLAVSLFSQVIPSFPCPRPALDRAIAYASYPIACLAFDHA